MPEEINTTAAVQDTPAEKTFTQAEVDAVVERRLARAMKGMPTSDELTAFRSWKDSQQSEQERWDSLTKERDDAQTALTAAQAELEQIKRERYLIGKGVPADDVDYYAYKISKLVTDKVTFEAAADAYLQESGSAKVRVDMTGSLGGSGKTLTANESMNALIRGARK